MKIEANADQVEQLAARINKLTEKLRDKQRLFELAAVLGVEGVRANFRTQKDSENRNWPKLKYRSGTPLVDKIGRIPKGITYKKTASGYRIGAGLATKAFNAVHNFGSMLWHKTGGRKGNPRRQFMYISRVYVGKIVTAVRGAVRREMLTRG